MEKLDIKAIINNALQKKHNNSGNEIVANSNNDNKIDLNNLTKEEKVEPVVEEITNTQIDLNNLKSVAEKEKEIINNNGKINLANIGKFNAKEQPKVVNVKPAEITKNEVLKEINNDNNLLDSTIVNENNIEPLIDTIIIEENNITNDNNIKEENSDKPVVDTIVNETNIVEENNDKSLENTITNETIDKIIYTSPIPVPVKETQPSISNLFQKQSQNDLQNFLNTNLHKEIRKEIIYHLIHVFFYTLRDYRAQQFMTLMTNMLRFKNNNEISNSIRQKIILDLQTNVETIFKSLNIFNLTTLGTELSEQDNLLLDIPSQNKKLWENFNKINKKSDLQNLYQAIQILSQQLNVVFNNQTQPLSVSLAEIENVFAENFYNLRFLFVFSSQNEPKNNQALYLEKTLNFSYATIINQTTNSNELSQLDKLIWFRNTQFQISTVGYETMNALYDMKYVYDLYATYLYLTKHKSLQTNWLSYNFSSFPQIVLQNGFRLVDSVRKLDILSLTGPILDMFYLNKDNETLINLSKTNNIVRLVNFESLNDNALNISFTKKDYLTYGEVLENAKTAIKRINNQTLNITDIHSPIGVLSNDLNFLSNGDLLNNDNQQNIFKLQITNYNTSIKTSEYAVLINDNVNETNLLNTSTSDITKSAELAKLNDRIVELNKIQNETDNENELNAIKNEFAAISNRKATLINEILPLKLKNALIDFVKVNKEMREFIFTFAKNSQV